MQRLALASGAVALLSGVALAVVEPDLSVMILAAVCTIGAIVGFCAAIVRTLQWAAKAPGAGRGNR